MTARTCAGPSGVSRSGSTVTNSTCSLSRVRPQLAHHLGHLRPAWSGQASGQWVKPKNTATTLPLKSASERSFPLWSGRLSSFPKLAPVMSVSGNCGRLRRRAARSNRQRSEMQRQQQALRKRQMQRSPTREPAQTGKRSNGRPAAPRTAPSDRRSNSGKCAARGGRCRRRRYAPRTTGTPHRARPPRRGRSRRSCA